MKKPNMFFTKKNKGAIITLVLVFGAIFLVLLGGITSLVLLYHRQSVQKAASEDSLHIAEAGVNYYRWKLNNNQSDYQDGQSWCCSSLPCGEWCGPYQHDFRDPNGNLIGKFTLEIRPKIMCGEVLGVWVRSTGYTLNFPNTKRTVQVKFAATSIADYAYIINDNVWAGGDRVIFGKYHSNGGIKMDGTGNSLITSARNTWLCTNSFGCDSANCPSDCTATTSACICPGVFGGGSPTDLWDWPVVPFDFLGITSDLSRMKTLAINKGLYYAPSTTTNPNGKGYHVIYNSDGTFTIKIITQLQTRNCYSLEEGWHSCAEKISNETDYQNNVSLPVGCGLIFVEDNLWVEGTIKDQKTIASANLIDPQKDTGVILNGNINYTTSSGADSLAVITEKDILIPLESPDQMNLDGVFVAQKGHFGRNHYDCGQYPSWCKRSLLNVLGTIVSNGREGTKWTSGSTWVSGYNQRNNYFDQKLASDPPPLLPYVSEDLNFISWEEIQ